MSFRELRNFTEMMRALGYPRLISMENFRKPNFELVADILFFMIKLYDPETTISDRVEFENERVEFLTKIAALMATKARLKLNTKKLYASDGRAVQELLKLASLLYKATKSCKEVIQDESPLAAVKVQDVHAARDLAKDITQSGLKLFDLLATEVVERKERARSINFLGQASSSADNGREQKYIEQSIREIIDATRQSVDDMQKECEEAKADEINIVSKIKKRDEELKRTEQRLLSIQQSRQKSMKESEKEKLEKELERHYEIYMEKYRNLDYLEHELEKYHRDEQERKEEQERKLKKMRERLLKEEVDLLRGGQRDDEPSYTKYESRVGGEKARSQAALNRNSDGGQARIQGNLQGGDSGDSSEGEGSFSGASREEESDEEELSIGPNNTRAKTGEEKSNGGGNRRRAGSDSDGFLDGDDDEEEDDDDDDDGDEDSGSDENF